MVSLNKIALAQSDEESEISEAISETLCFLVDLFDQCTKENPADSLKAQKFYKILLSVQAMLKVQEFRNVNSFSSVGFCIIPVVIKYIGLPKNPV